MVSKNIFCALLIVIITSAFIQPVSPMISYEGFELKAFKLNKDTSFKPAQWKPYLRTGETDLKKCGPGVYSQGIAITEFSSAQARRGTRSGFCVLDVSNGGVAHKAMFRNDFLPRGNNWGLPGNERWIAFSIFLPDKGADEWVTDQTDELIFQLHNDTIASPQLALYSHSGLFSVEYKYADKDPHVIPHTTLTSVKPWEGDIKKGRWIDWIWHVQFSPLEKQGLLEVWFDQGKGLKKIVNEHHIRVGYPCNQETTFDIGIYKWPWKCPQTSPVKRRVIYIDEIKVANAQADLQEMLIRQK